MRKLLVVIALVLVAASPIQAKKRHTAHGTKRVKHAAVKVQKSPPTRLASAAEPKPEIAVTPPAPVASPSASAAPPVPRGPAVEQAGDDEVPGARMKRR
jgi:hypothetical protein